MFKRIVKRDGKIVKFDPEKITEAIAKQAFANYENSCKVCQRFIASFERKYPHSPVYIDYYVQAVIPSTQS